MSDPLSDRYADFARERRLAVISEVFAEHHYPNENPVGKLVGPPLERGVRDQREEYELVGVVKDARLGGLRREHGPMI